MTQPLDLSPVRFETPIGTLAGPVVVETEDGATTVLEFLGPDGGGSKVRISAQSASDPTYVHAVSPALELGELAIRHLSGRPVRAFALPPGSMQARHQLRVLAVASAISLAALALITVVLLSGLPAAAKSFVTTALVALAILAPLVPAKIRPAVRHVYRTGGASYPLNRLLDGRPAAQAAAALVAAVKEEYGALLSDICYRIENPAMFDPADDAARRLTTALIRWDEGQGRLDSSELSVAAAEVRVAFDAAKAHAEAVGMAYLPEHARPRAETALKAARLARSTTAPAERAAALKQVSAILGDLALYYLPSPAEASLMIEGRPVLALPGRVTREDKS
ncbi:MAG: hypothetical protein QM713_13310 [Arachnia sp.]